MGGRRAADSGAGNPPQRTAWVAPILAMQRACHVEMMRPRPYADGAIAGCGVEEPRRPVGELVRKFAWFGELVAN